MRRPAIHSGHRRFSRFGAMHQLKARPGQVESSSPKRTRGNSGIYGVSRSYGSPSDHIRTGNVLVGPPIANVGGLDEVFRPASKTNEPEYPRWSTHTPRYSSRAFVVKVSRYTYGPLGLAWAIQ